MPLSHYLQSTNPNFKNKAGNAGEVQWRPGTEHFAPVMLEMPNAWGSAISLDICWQHCSSPAEITSWFWCLAGILKFHEYYLGDSLTENAGDFHEANSVALQTVTNSALEQHISSVREALGVDSYYTRWAGIRGSDILVSALPPELITFWDELIGRELKVREGEKFQCSNRKKALFL